MNTFLRTFSLLLLVVFIFISATNIFCSPDDATSIVQESNCPIHAHTIQSIKPYTLADITIYSIDQAENNAQALSFRDKISHPPTI